MPDRAPKEGWKVGDRVVAYNLKAKTNKMQQKDYHGKITAISENLKFFTIKYDDGSQLDTLERFLFVPGESCPPSFLFFAFAVPFAYIFVGTGPYHRQNHNSR